MKKKFFSIVACLIMTLCCLAGCGAAALSGGPKLDDTVYGNGGIAVRKGEYVYFVNAFTNPVVDYGKNKFGKETLSAIYRTKVDDRGLLETDAEGNIKQAEVVAKQINGFKNAGLYIFGDYIYYTTPKAAKDSSGSQISNLVSFERIKLNGTKHDTLYTTEKEVGSDFKFQMYQAGDKVYALILDNKQLISVSAKVTGGKATTKILDKDVTSAVFAKVDTLDKDYSVSDFNTYAYYTKASTIENDGIANYTLINKIKIDGSEEAKNLKRTDEEYTLVEVKNNRLYYTYEDGLLYSSDLTSVINPESDKFYSSNTLSSYKILEDQVFGSTKTDLGVVAVLSNSLVYFNANGEFVNLVNGSSKAVTLRFVQDNYVYYTVADDEALYRKVIYKNRSVEEIAAERDIAGQKVMDKYATTAEYTVGEGDSATTENYDVCDYDSEYYFYFAKATDSNQKYSYMHMVKFGAQDAEGGEYNKLIGVLDSTDVKEKA